jgi:hypothetical protein
LPATDHEFAEWRLARVSLDYHIEIEGFYYSVPHRLIREQVDTRRTMPRDNQGERRPAISAVAAHL